MKKKELSSCLRLLVLATFAAVPAIGSAERIGLHVTTEELEIWRDRAQSGPYKTAGDVAVNSPGDWSRIVRNADAFLSNPNAERWSGQTSGCWQPVGPPALPGRSAGELIRDAAFASLVTGNAQYRDAVRSVLLAQAADPGTNFESSRWCDTSIGESYSHEIAAWLLKMLYAYDYIRPQLSSADRAPIERWLDGAANFWSAVAGERVEYIFPNRELDDYSDQHGAHCTFGTCITHYKGWPFYNFHEYWNNRNGIQIAFAGSAAILTGNSVVQSRAKRFFKEWLRYATFSDGTDSDFRRWSESQPSQGWSYATLMVGSMVVLADHFARAGDPELYEYSTSEGYGSLTPSGGPKNLESMIRLNYSMVNGDEIRYGTKDPAKAGDPNYVISSLDKIAGYSWVYDTGLTPANVYFRDDFFRSIYMRTAPNTPPYPARPYSGGWEQWAGHWGTLPGVMLMFGNMENKVWPYGTKARPKPPILTGVE